MILAELKPWKDSLDAIGRRVVGSSEINMERVGCNSRECDLGNFITDIFVHHYATEEPKQADEWTSSCIAIVNTGGLRTTIEKGGKQALIDRFYLHFTHGHNIPYGNYPQKSRMQI